MGRFSLRKVSSKLRCGDVPCLQTYGLSFFHMLPLSLAKLIKSSLDLLTCITKKGIQRRKCQGTQYYTESRCCKRSHMGHLQAAKHQWLRTRLSGLQFWLCSFLALRSWPNYFISQPLFLICKTRTL